jgi:hypothetical protein
LFFIPTNLRSNRLSQTCEVEELSIEGLRRETFSRKDYFNSEFSAVEIMPVAADELSLSYEPKTYAITQRNASSVSSEIEKVQEEKVFLSECYFPVRSGDSRNVQAFCAVLSELVSRRQASRWSVARWFRSEDLRHRHDPRPALCDFAGDIFLCAKESLPIRQYRIFCAFVNNDLRNWERVPAGIRLNIQEKVGATLLRKQIIVHGSTKNYWKSTTLSKRAAS